MIKSSEQLLYNYTYKLLFWRFIYLNWKQGQQGQQRFHSSNHHKWLPYQIPCSKTVKNCPNRSTNNRDMTEIAKRSVIDGVTEWICDIYVIKIEDKLLKIFTYMENFSLIDNSTANLKRKLDFYYFYFIWYLNYLLSFIRITNQSTSLSREALTQTLPQKIFSDKFLSIV